MPTPKPANKYPGTQAELYAVCKLGWASYAENVADFTAFKTFYDAAYGTAALAAVNAAQAMPDEQTRGAAAESLLIAMRQKANAAILKWKTLRAYIKSAYPGEETKPQEEAAGYGYYDTATKEDWEDLELMLSSGASFIANHTADLTADGGMPAGFELSYNTAKGEYSTLYGQFKDAQQDSPEATDAKIIANNAIYDALMKMFDDGQIIYDDNAAKRDRFIYAQVKSLVTPGGGGGGTLPATTLKISGTVTDGTTNDPLADAKVEFIVAGEPTVERTTNASGFYEFEFTEMTAGEEIAATLKVSNVPGYVDHEQAINVTVGNAYTFNVGMVN